jgi:uncharacterized protein (DUF2141 family)
MAYDGARDAIILFGGNTGGSFNADTWEYVCTPCRADLNGDGRTGLADLGILLADFGCTCPPRCVGDVNGDGQTDLNDLGTLLEDFGCIVP